MHYPRGERLLWDLSYSPPCQMAADLLNRMCLPSWLTRSESCWLTYDRPPSLRDAGEVRLEGACSTSLMFCPQLLGKENKGSPSLEAIPSFPLAGGQVKVGAPILTGKWGHSTLSNTLFLKCKGCTDKSRYLPSLLPPPPRLLQIIGLRIRAWRFAPALHAVFFSLHFLSFRSFVLFGAFVCSPFLTLLPQRMQKAAKIKKKAVCKTVFLGCSCLLTFFLVLVRLGVSCLLHCGST